MSAPDFDFRVCPVCGKTFIKPVESIYFMKDSKDKRKKATSEEESS